MSDSKVAAKSQDKHTSHAFPYPELIRVGISSVGFERMSADYCVSRLNPGFGHLSVCYEGTCEIYFQGVWQSARAGDLVVHPIGQAHGCRGGDGQDFALAWIIFSEGKQAAKQASASLWKSDEDTELLLAAIRIFCAISMGRAEWSAQIRQASAMMLNARILDLLAPGERQDQRIFKLWETVSSQLDVGWTVDSLARKVGLSESHLRRLCQATWGRSPMAHLAYLRLQHAAYLLKYTDSSMEQISSRVGYSDAFAFSKAFKRVIGVNPRDYRNSP